MEKTIETELIRQAQAGDQRSFAVLCDHQYMTVYRYAYKWCRSREDAEDITQEVFIKLARKIHLFDNRAKFTTWLYRMTANCARDHARKNSGWTGARLPDPPDDNMTASANPGPESIIIARNILKSVHQLPEKLKEAVLLVFAEGMSHKEAAGVIGCAETTVSWRIFQAKRQLRKILS